MSLADRWHWMALATVFGVGVMLLSAPARAGDSSAEPKPAATSDESCEPGHAREGRGCMHRIAPPGACAGDCGGGTIGAASERFSPTDVAADGSDDFNPPTPPPLPKPEPCDIGGCGPDPKPVPPITVRESPARPDPLPGLP
jgi:hypothetical protein